MVPQAFLRALRLVRLPVLWVQCNSDDLGFACQLIPTASFSVDAQNTSRSYAVVQDPPEPLRLYNER